MSLLGVVALFEVEQEYLAVQVEVGEVLGVVLLSIYEHVLVVGHLEAVVPTGLSQVDNFGAQLGVVARIH